MAQLMAAIIVDIDGTIADKGNRDPYDWSKVIEDTPHTNIMILVHMLSAYYEPIFMSGRSDVCRVDTLKWLNKQAFTKPLLYMRKDGDYRPDTEIKKEMYHQHVVGKWDIRFVLDDRNKVVEMWREQLGLTCLQVADGDF